MCIRDRYMGISSFQRMKTTIIVSLFTIFALSNIAHGLNCESSGNQGKQIIVSIVQAKNANETKLVLNNIDEYLKEVQAAHCDGTELDSGTAMLLINAIKSLTQETSLNHFEELNFALTQVFESYVDGFVLGKPLRERDFIYNDLPRSCFRIAEKIKLLLTAKYANLRAQISAFREAYRIFSREIPTCGLSERNLFSREVAAMILHGIDKFLENPPVHQLVFSLFNYTMKSYLNLLQDSQDSLPCEAKAELVLEAADSVFTDTHTSFKIIDLLEGVVKPNCVKWLDLPNDYQAEYCMYTQPLIGNWTIKYARREDTIFSIKPLLHQWLRSCVAQQIVELLPAVLNSTSNNTYCNSLAKEVYSDVKEEVFPGFTRIAEISDTKRLTENKCWDSKSTCSFNFQLLQRAWDNITIDGNHNFQGRYLLFRELVIYHMNNCLITPICPPLECASDDRTSQDRFQITFNCVKNYLTPSCLSDLSQIDIVRRNSCSYALSLMNKCWPYQINIRNMHKNAS
eukprot:TRINITY_DN1374_c0_g1_i15.p1 TRINITY_DN1374_c0_g1~~TRINITY_DN1374_c0_g1_i15.p1  ORF type:complete len:513 (-),score=96.10 TRINITY_DN1374_c0_g1_i15:591-2129(-)